MQVYKAFLKIAVKMISSLIVYLVIFTMVNVIIGTIMYESDGGGYANAKETIFIIDEDNTEASRALSEYLGKKHTLAHYDSYDTELLQDNLYYRTLSYVLTIKEGYSQKLENGSADGLFESASVSGSFASQYVESDITLYVSDMRMYLAGGFSLDEAIEKTAAVVADEGVPAEVMSFGAKIADETAGFYYYFRYMPYVMTAVIIGGIVPILIILNKRDLRMRNCCAPLSATSLGFQTILGTITVCVAYWFAFVVTAGILYPDGAFGRTHLLMLLNTVLLLLVSAGVALLTSAICKDNNYVVSMINNIYVLGSCFLCGVFVPQSMLGDGVVAASHFLPAYWYTRANDILGGEAIGADGELTLCYIMQLVFAAGLFAVSLLLIKRKRVEAK